ncbi:ENTH/ANTH/VHS superfamily protein [Actinidia rufa]|uniref:ENTH/ANTH/VHS superfamily protein n=1 Tax=Actinidia rufa TaxID=165716 RepID=A0A7J0DGU3_9ERIC|nr:ENTH/ANTH/VHS superfamily protein [Actinidia rufa]
MPSKLKKAIGAVKDQTSISLAKVASNASSSLEVAVLKATTHDDVPVDERYVHEILLLVSSNQSNAAACARAIGKRISRTRNWIVAVKSLMLVLRIFQDGDPYFPREVLHAMKRGAKILNLSSFRDDSNSSPWDYTAFVRTFSLYLDERLDCFLTGKLQRRYTHHEREPFHRRSRQGVCPEMEVGIVMKLGWTAKRPRPSWRGLGGVSGGCRGWWGMCSVGNVDYGGLGVERERDGINDERTGQWRPGRQGRRKQTDSSKSLCMRWCKRASTCTRTSPTALPFSSTASSTSNTTPASTPSKPASKPPSNSRSSPNSTTSASPLALAALPSIQASRKSPTSSSTRSASSSKTTPPSRCRRTGCSSQRHRGPWGRGGGGDSDEQSEFSKRRSEFGSLSEFGSRSCTSLEDLISATEMTRKGPSISIDLEAYSITDMGEKGDDEGSTRSGQSLPVSTSLIDLVSLDELPQREEPDLEKRNGEEDPPQEQSPATGWELVLAEAENASSQVGANKFDPFSSLQLIPTQNPNLSESGSGGGWELALAETAMPQTHLGTDGFSFSAIANLSQQYYNPFLQDTTELTAIVPFVAPATGETIGGGVDFLGNDGFSSLPTFQATPTFCAQNTNNMNANDPFGQYAIEGGGPGFRGLNTSGSDPFGAYPIGGGEQSFSGSTNQQNLLLEQQFWLQHQNKIIARHMA